MRKLCNIEGCGKQRKGNGYCHKHNARFKQYGDPEITKSNYNIAPGEAGLNFVYYQYERRANQKNRIFDLSREEFRKLTSSNCFYCKIPPLAKTSSTNGTKGVYTYNGIDRIDNDQGYTLENSVPCCKFCNYAKNKFQVTEFTEWLDYVRRTKE